MKTAGLAPSTISKAAQVRACGAPEPPRCSGRSRENQSPSSMARTDRLKLSGRVTEEVAGSNTGGLRSASAKDSASGPSASRRISASTPRAVSTSIWANGPVPNRSLVSRNSKRLNSRSRRFAV
jgi:hypothetical protein